MPYVLAWPSSRQPWSKTLGEPYAVESGQARVLYLLGVPPKPYTAAGGTVYIFAGSSRRPPSKIA